MTLKKSLGQNFLSNEVYAKKIVEISQIKPNDTVLEIGAGAGTLTVALAETGATIYAIEIDERLKPVLEERLLIFPNVHLIFSDFLALDISFLPDGYKCVSNIPYYITAPILKKLIFTHFSALFIMMQKEVGERLLEKAGSSNRGFLTVVLQTVGDIEKLLTVPKSAFVPNPEVDSVVLKITRKTPFPFSDDSELESFWKFVSDSFAQKRKTIYNNLRAFVRDNEVLAMILEEAIIQPTARPEQLTEEQFLSLWRIWLKLTGGK
ncbi:16S rRNA (adenine(1518)-N(6)/adenine(1519)-N(6))-dimethyltransferase RsmA [Fervidobacterium changbaicum]|uniref:Ribosomal RNA small subunit methyltransferase A n=1 Tax=Fervidobacterium changbaicum TaxID=310769 RepID=A0ABX5QPF6_9BACT|nr:16S rRNA (adenine(1518)-N(6)/adenine(1519)-N(6))-dimethyltransferase RsmA [Fervidobacterium changbaicum]QAV32324.1 ribosomal RNA small subunit methyltransferase A [Fervidobacterium changbaicum]